MIALGLDVWIGLSSAAVVAAVLIADLVRRADQKRRRPQDRDQERRKYWGYV